MFTIIGDWQNVNYNTMISKSRTFCTGITLNSMSKIPAQQMISRSNISMSVCAYVCVCVGGQGCGCVCGGEGERA